MAKEKFKVCPECGDKAPVDLARLVCNKCDVLYEVEGAGKKPTTKKKPRGKA